MQNPLRIGWRSVGANVVPMVVLWIAAVALVTAYYRLPVVASALEPLMKWQRDCGWSAAFLNRVFFCGIVPGLFLVSGWTARPKRVGLVVLAYSLWGGAFGILCDCFFRIQSDLFGTGTDVWTLARKTAVDQFVWNALVCTPAGALFFPWVDRDFKRGRWKGLRSFVFVGCLSILVSNWMVWIPVMVAVYAFPLPLQVQLVGLASSFWMLVALRAHA